MKLCSKLCSSATPKYVNPKFFWITTVENQIDPLKIFLKGFRPFVWQKKLLQNLKFNFNFIFSGKNSNPPAGLENKLNRTILTIHRFSNRFVDSVYDSPHFRFFVSVRIDDTLNRTESYDFDNYGYSHVVPNL